MSVFDLIETGNVINNSKKLWSHKPSDFNAWLMKLADTLPTGKEITKRYKAYEKRYTDRVQPAHQGLSHYHAGFLDMIGEFGIDEFGFESCLDAGLLHSKTAEGGRVMISFGAKEAHESLYARHLLCITYPTNREGFGDIRYNVDGRYPIYYNRDMSFLVKGMSETIPHLCGAELAAVLLYELRRAAIWYVEKVKKEDFECANIADILSQFWFEHRVNRPTNNPGPSYTK